MALVWCFQHLEEGLDAPLLAGLYLQEQLDRGLVRGDVPPNLLDALEEADAQRELEGLVEDRLLYERRGRGFQVTEAGMVLGRAMAQATAAARGYAQDVLLGTSTQAPVGLLNSPPPEAPPGVSAEELDQLEQGTRDTKLPSLEDERRRRRRKGGL